ncbi:MAG TPA: TetR/AcrR family transcriptional regulator [Byssovorax sp.]|jgi:AcrR family transcriptional regulator
MARAKKKAAAPPRKRRTAEDAREAILDAAERRLAVAGPAGIRLQEVAADVGVSHPTVLHHFGSRAELVREVCRRGFEAILTDVVHATATSEGGVEHFGAMLESVSNALEREGHGRVYFWLALEGVLGAHEGPHMRALGDAAHALRKRHRGADVPPIDDTRHVLALASLVLLAESVVGPRLLADLGLGEGPEPSKKFRAWLAKLLVDHLEHGPR